MLKKYSISRKLKKGAEIEDSIMTITEKEEVLMELPIKRNFASFVWYFIVMIIIFLFGRVFYLQVVKGEYYGEVARENRIRSIVVKAPRGNILDKFGKVLARNVPSLDAVVVPFYLPKDFAKRQEMIKGVSEILGMSEGNVEAIFENQKEKSLDAYLLKENISQDQALILAERQNDFSGVFVDKTAIRSYSDGMIFSHVIGYDGKITQEEMNKNRGSGYLMTDYIGKNGLEKQYEKNLRGTYGSHQVEIDSKGDVKREIGSVSPKPGSDLVLNIDEELQKKIYDGLSGILEKSNTKTAAAVAIDPRNGGVLAEVSLPSYDNNSFARGISDDEYKELIGNKDLPLFDRAISGEYPPGSTIKPVMAAAGLSENVISPETIIDGLGGALHIGNFSFRDWKAHGPSDVKKAIAESNDIFFYTIGGGYGKIGGLGIDRMKKYYNLFGFGEKTGIDLGSESSGLIPDEEWKQTKIKEKWYVGNTYHASIGQGFVTATPLQLANYTASIANGGTLYSPRVVNRVEKGGGKKDFVGPDIIRKNFVSKNVLDVVREGMRQTVLSGTAQTLKDLPVAVAGKTGTAQFGTEDKTHAWFISFAPYDDPVIAMAILVEGGGEGHSSALPVTHDVYRWYFERDDLQP